MGNPDRLDGFHDYYVSCRKKNDPGRSDQNMKMYNLDRRTFEYWVQGIGRKRINIILLVLENVQYVKN